MALAAARPQDATWKAAVASLEKELGESEGKLAACTAHEEHVAARALRRAEADDAVEPRKTGPQESRALTIDTETVSAEPEDAQQSKKSKESLKELTLARTSL